MDKDVNIEIQEECDAFVIQINGTRFRFDQEDNKESLVSVFKYLGFTNVQYEEVY